MRDTYEMKGNNINNIVENGSEDTPTQGVESFLNEFDLRLNDISSFLDKLSDNNLNKEERTKMIDLFIQQAENFTNFCLEFMNKKRTFLEKKYSYQCSSIVGRIHDLKNQIAPLVVFASDFLKEEGISKDEFDSYINTMKAGLLDAQEMSKDFKNADLENPEIKLSYTDVSNLLKDLSSKFSHIAETKSITIKEEIKPQIVMYTCSEVIQSAIRNLFNNAIKFTNEGGEVSISLDKEGESVVIKIMDNGMGIPKEKQEHLFDKMGQTSKGTNGEMGTGVGLYVNFNEIKKLGGNLEVKSEGEGKGSTFIITLPKGKE